MSLKQKLKELEERRERWKRAPKPVCLFESYEDRDKFEALFDKERGEIVSNENTFRSVWWNGAPNWPGDKIPLLGWHPMVHASLSGAQLGDQIGAVLDTIDYATLADPDRAAWYWQDEATRWVWLTLHPPSGRTHFFARVLRNVDGQWVWAFEGIG